MESPFSITFLLALTFFLICMLHTSLSALFFRILNEVRGGKYQLSRGGKGYYHYYHNEKRKHVVILPDSVCCIQSQLCHIKNQWGKHIHHFHPKMSHVQITCQQSRQPLSLHRLARPHLVRIYRQLQMVSFSLNTYHTAHMVLMKIIY